MTEERPGEWPEPTDAQLARLQSLTAHLARLLYFFSRLDNPRWLEQLADHGWFDPERVPEPVIEADGTARIETWPLSGYLCRVAGEVPATAAAVVKNLAGTANPLVQRDLVTTLLRLPADVAAGFTDDVTAWIRGPYARSLDERDVAELAVKLLDEGHHEAGQRIASVILTWLTESYWLRDAVALLADPLQRSGVSGVLVLADALDRAIGDDASAEVASFGRASIADHDQNQHFDAADYLIDGLRDSALSYLNRTGNIAVLVALMHRRAVLHTRIAYYVLAAALSGSGDSGTDPAAAARIEALRDHARTLLTDKSAFDNSRTRLEYGILTRTMLAHLQPAEVARLAAWIRQGPPMSDAEVSRMIGSPGAPASAERIAAFRDHWRADRLGVLGPELPQPLRNIASDLAARGVSPPEHPGFSHWMVEAAIESPLSAQELASMDVTDVTALIRAYEPPPRTISRFPEFALAQQVTEDIATRPAEYSLHAPDFARLQPGYVNAFLNGLRQAIEAHGRGRQAGVAALALEVAWDSVLNLAASIVGKPDPGGRNTEQTEDSPRWLHRGVTMLLKAALATPNSGLAARYANDLLALLGRLLESPDPLPADDSPEDALDPADRALNSVRGQAAVGGS